MWQVQCILNEISFQLPERRRNVKHRSEFHSWEALDALFLLEIKFEFPYIHKAATLNLFAGGKKKRHFLHLSLQNGGLFREMSFLGGGEKLLVRV